MDIPDIIDKDYILETIASKAYKAILNKEISPVVMDGTTQLNVSISLWYGPGKGKQFEAAELKPFNDALDAKIWHNAKFKDIYKDSAYTYIKNLERAVTRLQEELADQLKEGDDCFEA